MMTKLVDTVKRDINSATVSRLGFGASGLGGMFKSVTDADAELAVQCAIDSGITYFDVAPFYGHGTAERRLGSALASVPRSSFTISTKVGRIIVPKIDGDTGIFFDAEPSDAVFDYSRDAVFRSLEASLERLGLDSIDIVYIHDPDDHEKQALIEAYPALEDLRAQGVVKAIGLGMNQSAMLDRFISNTDIDLVLLAGRYTLMDQSAAKGLIPHAISRGVSIINAGVLNSGILASPTPHARYDYAQASDAQISVAQELQATCGEFGVPLSAAAIQFSLNCPAVASVLVGCRSAEQQLRNLEDFEHDIPEELWTALAKKGIERWA